MYLNDFLGQTIRHIQITPGGHELAILLENGYVLSVASDGVESHIHVVGAEMPLEPNTKLHPLFWPCQNFFAGPLDAFTPMMPPNPNALSRN